MMTNATVISGFSRSDSHYMYTRAVFKYVYNMYNHDNVYKIYRSVVLTYRTLFHPTTVPKLNRTAGDMFGFAHAQIDVFARLNLFKNKLLQYSFTSYHLLCPNYASETAFMPPLLSSDRRPLLNDIPGTLG